MIFGYRTTPVTRDLSEGLVVHIDEMKRRHLRAVLHIEAQVYPRPWSLGLFMSELAMRHSRSYTVAKVDGRVVGYSGLMINMEEGHITNIAVDPAWQGRQIGTRLLVDVARVALRRGVKDLTLEVRVSNHVAQRLYSRFGFEPAGIRKNYYPETNEDAIIMWAYDIDSPAYQQRLAEIEAGIRGRTVVEEGRW